jgi:hypothetical protein
MLVLFLLISLKFSARRFIVIVTAEEPSAAGGTSTGQRMAISPLTTLKNSSRLDVNLCDIWYFTGILMLL